MYNVLKFFCIIWPNVHFYFGDGKNKYWNHFSSVIYSLLVNSSLVTVYFLSHLRLRVCTFSFFFFVFFPSYFSCKAKGRHTICIFTLWFGYSIQSYLFYIYMFTPSFIFIIIFFFVFLISLIIFFNRSYTK